MMSLRQSKNTFQNKGGEIKMLELYTTQEVAEILKISETTVREWLRAGRLKGVKTGNKLWRIKEEDLINFLNECEEAEKNGFKK